MWPRRLLEARNDCRDRRTFLAGWRPARLARKPLGLGTSRELVRSEAALFSLQLRLSFDRLALAPWEHICVAANNRTSLLPAGGATLSIVAKFIPFKLHFEIKLTLGCDSWNSLNSVGRGDSRFLAPTYSRHQSINNMIAPIARKRSTVIKQARQPLEYLYQ